MTDLLLVEDDPAIVTALSDFLKREGFAVTAASGQTEALRLLEGRRFHLALLDVTLPDGSGFALCAAIKAQYHMPVMFLTALADESSTVAGLELGATTTSPSPSAPGAGEPDSERAPPVRRRTGPLRLGPIPGGCRPGVSPRMAGSCRCPPGVPAAPPVLQQSWVVLSRSRILDEIWDLAGTLSRTTPSRST